MNTTARFTATSRSASNIEPRRFVLICNPDGRRATLFQETLARQGQTAAQTVSYLDLITGKVHLAEVVRPGDIVRLESPGRDWEVEVALLRAGLQNWREPEEHYTVLSSRQLDALNFEKGRVLASRQWFVGWRSILETIQTQLTQCPPVYCLQSPAEIGVMFDKAACQHRLRIASVPVPRPMGILRDFEDVTDAMMQHNRQRVFIKLAHGSSASGVVAYRTDGHRHQALTTVEMVESGGEIRLYNSRKLQKYEDVKTIATLIDVLCRHRVHVEEWIPKAGFAGRVCDLRVVVIGKRARHTVVRLSRGPMTNLHLLNERGDTEALRAAIPPADWEVAMHSCETAMSTFPNTLYGGVDLLFTPGFKRHAVLEVNAFGDLLPGVLDTGQETYDAEIQLALKEAECSTRVH